MALDKDESVSSQHKAIMKLLNSLLNVNHQVFSADVEPTNIAFLTQAFHSAIAGLVRPSLLHQK